MRRLFGLTLGVPALLLALAACQEDTGYVEIKVTPGFVVPALVLGASRIDTSRAASTVLRDAYAETTRDVEGLDYRTIAEVTGCHSLTSLPSLVPISVGTKTTLPDRPSTWG